MGIAPAGPRAARPCPEGRTEAMLQGSPTAQTDGNVVMLPLRPPKPPPPRPPKPPPPP
jgi:hypothetical protein